MRLFYYLFITLVFFSCSKNVQLIFDENLKEMELREYLPHIKTPNEFEDIVK